MGDPFGSYVQFVRRFVQSQETDAPNTLYVYGRGNNGKSTFKRMVIKAFPKKTCTLPSGIIELSSSHSAFERYCRQIPTDAKICFIEEGTQIMDPIRMCQLAHRFPQIGFIINSNLSPPTELTAITLNCSNKFIDRNFKVHVA